MNLIEFLDEQKIDYQIQEHGKLMTIEEAKEVKYTIPGIGTKTLFLKDHKTGDFYIVVTHEDKKIDTKALRNVLQCGKLSFAHEQDTKEVLDLECGLTPCGVINDQLNKVKCVVFDKMFQNNFILVHPNDATKTMSIFYDDMLKFLDILNHKYIEIDME